MGRYGKVGMFRQVAHPRIRGALDPSHEQSHYGKMPRMEDYKADEETYFVPSFSIRRHLHRSEEVVWDKNQQAVKSRLGRGFTTLSPEEITLKTLEQKRFIKAMREAGIHPEPEEIKDLAYSIRDTLAKRLSNAYSPLKVPLGDLGKFGAGDNALAYTVDGWRGDRANYGENDEDGYMDTRAVLLAERRLAVGALALAYGDEGLRTDNIVSSPHLTIARGKDAIHEYQLRNIRGKLAGLAMDEVYLGDPVIEVKLYRDMPAEPLYVNQTWDSLAPDIPELLFEPDLSFDLDDDRYEALARQVANF